MTVFLLVSTSFLFSTAAEDIPVPRSFVYEGLLQLSADDAASTSYDLRFSLWRNGDFVAKDIGEDGEISPTATYYSGWQEMHQVVPAANGFFSVDLGTIDPLPTDLHIQQHAFLQVEVRSGNGDFQVIDFFPNDLQKDRKPIHSVPYAIRALYADKTSNESFTIDSDDTGAGEITLRFGSDLAKWLAYDIAGGYFYFNDDLLIAGDTTIEGDLTVNGLINGVEFPQDLSQIQTNADGIAALETDQTRQDADIANNAGDIAALEDDQIRQDEQVTELAEGIADVITAADALADKVANNEGDIADNADAIAALEADQDRQDAALNDVGEGLDILNDQITAHADEIAALQERDWEDWYVAPYLAHIENAQVIPGAQQTVRITGGNFDPQTRVEIPNWEGSLDQIAIRSDQIIDLTLTAGVTEESYQVILYNQEKSSTGFITAADDTGVKTITVANLLAPEDDLWIDLRKDKDDPGQLAVRSGTSIVRDELGMYNAGSSNIWSNWVKFPDLIWPRGENYSFAFVFRNNGQSWMVGIGSDEMDEVSTAQYYEPEVAAYLGGNNLWGYYGHNQYGYWNQYDLTEVEPNKYYKVIFYNDGGNGARIVVSEVTEEDWDTDLEILRETVSTNTANAQNLMPFAILPNNANYRLVAIKIEQFPEE